jgi:hypothetical protein
VSSSWKTRSAEAIADCMTAYLVENSRIGMKKRWMYSRKATSVPNAITPARMSPAAYHTMIAPEMLASASTIEKSAAS